MAKIGLIGCGMMGKGLAQRFLHAGHSLTIARNPASHSPLDAFLKDEAVRELIESGAQVTQGYEEVFSKCEVLALCVPDHLAVEWVLLGACGLEGHRESAVRLVIDFTSSHPDSTRKIAAALEKRGVDMLDAPMGGGPAQAAQGTLAVAVGGGRQVFEKYKELLSCVASTLVYAGPSGCGHALKLLNNALAILNWTATSAAYLLCDHAGADREALYALVSGSGANSAGFQTQSEKIRLNRYPGSFDLSYAEKDIRYAVEMMADSPLSYAPFAGAAELMARAKAAGYAGQDVGCIYKFMESGMKHEA
jgi:2-hydroxy-3-oxopropionate reductase